MIFEEFYKKNKRYVQYCFKQYKNEVQEEFVQDVFIKFYKQYKPEHSAKKFLNKIILDVHSRHKDYLTANNRLTTTVIYFANEKAIVDNLQDEQSSSAHKEFENNNDALKMINLTRLTPTEYKLLKLHYIDDMDRDEIAILTNKSYNTVKCTIFSGLKRMEERWANAI